MQLKTCVVLKMVIVLFSITPYPHAIKRPLCFSVQQIFLVVHPHFIPKWSYY